MTLDIWSVLPRIGFALIVGLIFFIILRSELGRLQEEKVGSHVGSVHPSVSPSVQAHGQFADITRLRRSINASEILTGVNSTTVASITIILSDQIENITAIKEDLEENRAETDFLFWIVFSMVAVIISSIFIVTIIALLQSRVSFSFSSRSRAYRDAWWESKDEDYVNYATFFRQNVKLVEEMDPIDADTRVHLKSAHPKRHSRHLSTIDERDELNENSTKQLITEKYLINLAPNGKTSGSIIIPDRKLYKIFKPPLVSMLYNAPDFRKSGMPFVCLPAKTN